MAHNYIIQWNCRGLRSNREDIELLISKYSPAAICLQETLLTPHQTQTFKHCKKLLKKAKIDVREIAINSIPDVPIWDSEPVTVDFTLSEFDKSSTPSTVFKSRFNEVKQKYLDFCHIYTDGSKVETKVASAYVCP